MPERRHLIDAGFFLTCYLVLLFAVRPTLVISPLGSMGSPALLLGVAGLAWWAFHQLQRPVATGRGPQPVRRALLVLAGAFAVSFVVVLRRPTSPAELSTATVGMVALASWAGVALLVSDGLTSHRRLGQVTNRLVAAAVALAALGIAQFATGHPLWAGLTLPGLRENALNVGVTVRDGFTRPAGTAVHPIEYGAVLTMVLPLAVVRSRHAVARRQQRLWLVGVALMGLGIVVSISRSALVCAVVGLTVLASAWPWRTRLRLGVGVLVLLAGVSAVVPGLLGSLSGLFLAAGEDASVASRTGSYGIAGAFFERSPWFGRGYATFLPSYRIFDNQYLLLLIEVGVVGLLAFLALVVTAMSVARRTGLAAPEIRRAEESRALLAGVAAGATGLALYDGLSFPLATGVLFVLIGLCGADRERGRRLSSG